MGSVRQEVRKIADATAMLTSINYHYYYPINLQDKLFPKEGRTEYFEYYAHKLAVDKVAYLEPNEIVFNISQINDELQKKYSTSKYQLVISLLAKLNTLLARLQTDESQNNHFKTAIFNSDLIKFSDEWAGLLATLADVIANPKDTKIPKIESKELKTWLMGAYTHACHYIKLQELELILAQDNKNTKPHPFKNLEIIYDKKRLPLLAPDFSKDIPEVEVNAIEEMAKIDGRQALPILLLLLEGIRKIAVAKIAKKELSPDLRKPLDIAIADLNDMDKRQHWGPDARNAFWVKSVATTVLDSLANLVKEISKLPMLDDAVHLSQLAIILMEGMYLRSHRLSNDDPENADFYNHSNVYKATIGVYYAYVSYEIRLKLDAFLKKNAIQNGAPAKTASTTKLELVQTIQDVNSGRDFLHVHDLDSKNGREMFSCWRNLLNDDKFFFSEAEEKLFSGLPKNIESMRTDYIENISYARWSAQFVFGSYADQVHLAALDQYMKNYLVENVTALQRLKGLLNLYDILRSYPAKSKTLAPLIVDFFVSAYKLYYGFHNPQVERRLNNSKN